MKAKRRSVKAPPKNREMPEEQRDPVMGNMSGGLTAAVDAVQAAWERAGTTSVSS